MLLIKEHLRRTRKEQAAFRSAKAQELRSHDCVCLLAYKKYAARRNSSSWTFLNSLKTQM